MAELTIEQRRAVALANARLRAQQAGTPAAAPVEQPPPEPGLWQKARPYVAPVVEGAGALVGGLVGAAAGVPASASLVANPVTLGVAGSGLGYAAGRQLMELGDMYLGGAKPDPLGQTAKEVAKDVLVGAALEAGGRVVLGSAAKAAGWVWDGAKGRLVQQRGGKIIREVAGKDLDAFKTALAASSPGDLRTAGQIAKDADITSPGIQALEKKASTSSLDIAKDYKMRSDVQEAGRISTLAGVTPNQQVSEAVRGAVSGILYGQADTMVLPAVPKALAARPAMQEAINEAATGLANRGKSLYDAKGNLTGEGAHRIKLALDDLERSTGAMGASATAGKKYAAGDIANARTSFIHWLEKQSPLYGMARQSYSQLSEPVNQATVLNAMRQVLEQPTGVGERVGPFMNVLGRGEQALLKRATGQPRFTELGDVLTPQQMGAVGDVANQLRRDAAIASEAQFGVPGVNRLLDETGQPTTAPWGLNQVITAANAVSRILQGKVNDKTMKIVAQAMLNGQDTLAIINMVPAKDRSVVLRAMQNLRPGGALASQNMLVGGVQPADEYAR